MLERYKGGEEELAADIWSEVERVAQIAGLDAGKFGSDHKEIVTRIASHLIGKPISDFENENDNDENEGWLSKLGWTRKDLPTQIVSQAISPIIICGVPGTGKTTFLYVLDRVMRTQFGLEDTVLPQMVNEDGRTFAVPKRMFCGGPVSLLSVRKWSELLHFYAWDIEETSFLTVKI